MLKLLKKIDDFCRNIEYYVASGSMIVLAVLLFGKIISRVVGSSWDFTEELCLLLIIVITYIGCIYCVRYGRHIRVTFLTDILPSKYQKPLYIVMCILSSFAFFFFTYFVFQYMLQAKALGRITAALLIPKWTFQIPIVVGLFFSAVQFAVTAVMNIVVKEKGYLGRNREMGDEIEIQ